MPDLSVIIPARNEEFLKRTVEDILTNMRGDTEIIVVADGNWPAPPLEDDKRVHMIYHSGPIGQRASVNKGVKLSAAKYVMKLDAHCTVGEGFDVIMMEDMQDDWTMVPKMYNLHAFNWVCKECGHSRYQGKSGKCEECSGEEKRDILWKPKKSPETTAMRFNRELRFKYWSSYKKQQEGDLVETMSILGACFMLTRERFLELDICDEAHGSWGQMGTEVACKTWLSGGSLICTKKTWFSHLFRTQGGDFGFPYPQPGSGVSKARRYSQDLWLNDKWDKAIHPLSWLIEKFNPPDWDDEGENMDKGSAEAIRLGAQMAVEGYPGVKLAKRLRDGEGAEEVVAEKLREIADWLSPKKSLTDDELERLKEDLGSAYTFLEPVVPSRPEFTRGIVFYTDNKCPLKIAHPVQDRLMRISQKLGIDIVNVSLRPHAHFGTVNVHMEGLVPGPMTLFLQILEGLKSIDADYVFFAEHDVLYHESHFDFQPPKSDVFYYNTNVWKVRFEDGFAARTDDCRQTSGLCAYRDLLIEHYKRRIELIDANGFSRRMGFEPGTHGREERVDDYTSDRWESEYPNIDIRHHNNLTKAKWKPEDYRNQRYAKGWTETDEVPGWGLTKGRFKEFLNG